MPAWQPLMQVLFAQPPAGTSVQHTSSCHFQQIAAISNRGNLPNSTDVTYLLGPPHLLKAAIFNKNILHVCQQMLGSYQACPTLVLSANMPLRPEPVVHVVALQDCGTHPPCQCHKDMLWEGCSYGHVSSTLLEIGVCPPPLPAESFRACLSQCLLVAMAGC